MAAKKLKMELGSTTPKAFSVVRTCVYSSMNYTSTKIVLIILDRTLYVVACDITGVLVGLRPY